LWHLPPLRRKLSLLKHRAELDNLCGLAEEHGVTHIHSAFAALPGLLAVEAARRQAITYSVSVHANDVAHVPFGRGYLFDGAAFVCVCNLRARDLLLTECPNLADKTPLIHHGLILKDWPFAPRPFPKHEPMKILFVGRLTAKKQCRLAIESVHALQCSGVPCKLCIAGDGTEKTELVALWQQECPGLDLEWLGVLTRAEVQQQMVTADLLLVTSVDLPDGDAEGIPNVVLEAMALGLPVAGTRCGSVAEVLNEQTGYLIPENASELVVQTITQMLKNPEEVQHRAAAARELVEDGFDADRLIAAKVELLRGQL
jgi:glycosyltransferase involved in cell wall biosynthesis